jgi:hypothetical protein
MINVAQKSDEMKNTLTLKFRILSLTSLLTLRHAKCRYSLHWNLSYFYLRLYLLYILKDSKLKIEFYFPHTKYLYLRVW